ncbi:MAG: phage tail protein [Firmicutes bacterium]|nr:phage tail protein [Bacillota bacterium]
MKIDFNNISEEGFESSAHKKELAIIRANVAKAYMEQYNLTFETVATVEKTGDVAEYVNGILAEQDITIFAKPLQVSAFEIEDTQITWAFYENGLVINVMYSKNNLEHRAVGLQLADKIAIPAELRGKLQFTTQDFDGITVQGSYFNVTQMHTNFVAT